MSRGPPKSISNAERRFKLQIRNVASPPKSCALEMAGESVFLHAVGYIPRVPAGSRFSLRAFDTGTPRDAVDLPSRPRRQYCRAPGTDAARTIAAQRIRRTA